MTIYNDGRRLQLWNLLKAQVLHGAFDAESNVVVSAGVVIVALMRVNNAHGLGRAHSGPVKKEYRYTSHYIIDCSRAAYERWRR